MAVDFWAATLEARRPKDKKQKSNVFNIPLNSAKQLIKHEKWIKTLLEKIPGLQKFTSHSLFWKELLNAELYQSKRVYLEREKKEGKEKTWGRGKRRELKVISRWNNKGRIWVNSCAPISEDNSPSWCNVTKRQPCLRAVIPRIPVPWTEN